MSKKDTRWNALRKVLKRNWRQVAFCIAITAVLTYGFSSYLGAAGGQVYGDIKFAAPIMSQIFGLAGLAWMILYAALHVDSAKVKLIGSGLVLSLAFAANNVWTYGLSIFIVATLVTELQFLEKLAAMFTNRDKYWEYLSQQSTPQQTVQKAVLEAMEQVDAEHKIRSAMSTGSVGGEGRVRVEDEPESAVETQGVNVDERSDSKEKLNVDLVSTPGASAAESEALSSRVAAVMRFHKNALIALKKYTSMLEGSQLYPDMQFSGHGTRFEVDAILKTDFADYVVEIKNAVTAFGVSSAQMTLVRLVNKYYSLIKGAGERKKVKGVLIVPKGVWVRREDPIDIVVLELDEKLKTLRLVDGSWS
ncbi:hypothetical protein QVM55_12660 [Pseudomonas monteilii]|uniref:hypothetical protein n=1 Tax=Pseudomonas monteilii TaxID=76759 RepID=UPI003524C40F